MIVVGNSSITSKQPRITLTNDRAIYAKGCEFETNGGKRKIDWVVGLHGALAGHNPDWLLEAIKTGAECNAPSIPSIFEQQAADALQEFYPTCSAVRFMSDGSNPNEAAVRLARAATGRKVVAFNGYHGVGTSFPHLPHANDLGIDERRGIPEEMWNLTKQFEWGDAGAIEKLNNAVAAIVIEVPPTDRGAGEFLRVCHDKAKEIGALFVIDDVVTNFRVAPGGAAERYGVGADLYCLGKMLGGGFNVSAIVGEKKILDLFTAGVHYSVTYAGCGIATSAVIATMRWIKENKGIIYPTLYARGELLKKSLNGVFESFGLPCRMVGNATRPILEGADDAWLKEWRRRMYERGYYVLAHPWYMTMAHTDNEIIATAEACHDVCKAINEELTTFKAGDDIRIKTRKLSSDAEWDRKRAWDRAWAVLEQRG